MAKIAVVTGANKGIGFALVEKLAQVYNKSTGWQVYLTARNVQFGATACNILKNKGLQTNFHELDICAPDSRAKFISYLKHKHPFGIHVLVNNAGFLYKDNSADKFGENARLVVNTNFTSTVDFTQECLPIFANNARIVNMVSFLARVGYKKLDPSLASKFDSATTLDELSSLMKDFVKHAEAGDHEQHGWPSMAYAISKLGLVKASYIIGNQLANDPRRIIINSCCPGYVKTDMTDHQGSKSPEDGADTPFYLATLPVGATEPINQFVHNRKVHNWLRN